MKRTTCASVLVLACSASIAPQEPAFSTKVEAVRVDVLVTEKGNAVLGLGADDFQVLDNGVPQDVDLVSFEQVPLNLIFVLDMSSSVIGDRLIHLRSGANIVLDGLRREDQAGLVLFSHAVVGGSNLTGDLERVRSALNRAGGYGQTALIDAVYAGMMVGESDVGRALMIVFSDGLDTSSWLTSDLVLDAARRSDVVAYAVTTRGATKASFLPDLSELTGGRLFEAESMQDLGKTFLGILNEFRQRYLVSYSPRGVSKEGWHRLEVRVKTRSATVKARPGYLAN
jgi:Ca-activated chloride channel homolog